MLRVETWGIRLDKETVLNFVSLHLKLKERKKEGTLDEHSKAETLSYILDHT
jgi:hypothetical protein